MLLALAVGVVIGAEWSRVSAYVGADARRKRERDKRKASFTVIRSEEEEFAESVQRDLDKLPTYEKDRR